MERQIDHFRLFQQCLCQINKNILLLFLSEEQLEEDKLHSNGGKVLSSELKNTNSGCCLCSSFLPLLFFLSHSNKSLGRSRLVL